MPQPRSSTAVWISLALIVASITVAGFGFQAVSASPSTKGLSLGVMLLFFGSMVGSIYFIARLAAAGVLIVMGRPLTRKVAWLSGAEAMIHCAIVLALVVLTIFIAPPQGFPLVAVGLAIALAALFVMSQYPNLCESQGWDVIEAAPAPASTRAASPAASRAAAPVIIAPLPPPVATEAPRAAGSADDRAPSLLR